MGLFEYNKMGDKINTKYGTKSYPNKTKKEAFIDFENYHDESIQYSFNAQIAKLKRELDEANEKVKLLQEEVIELNREIEMIKALENA